jgi:hypothetical protein
MSELRGLVFTGGKVVLDLYIEKVLSVTTDTLCVFMGSFSFWGKIQTNITSVQYNTKK